ncbi:hypothetical protein D3C85_947010 [compost metagenome]
MRALAAPESDSIGVFPQRRIGQGEQPLEWNAMPEVDHYASRHGRPEHAETTVRPAPGHIQGNGVGQQVNPAASQGKQPGQALQVHRAGIACPFQLQVQTFSTASEDELADRRVGLDGLEDSPRILDELVAFQRMDKKGPVVAAFGQQSIEQPPQRQQQPLDEEAGRVANTQALAPPGQDRPAMLRRLWPKRSARRCHAPRPAPGQGRSAGRAPCRPWRWPPAGCSALRRAGLGTWENR